MASKLIVEVSKIEELKSHPNADKLELAVIRGWQTIVRKDQYKDGDAVIFIPPDALIPTELADKLGIRNYLAGTEKNRVKTVRLRGEMSFGLVIDIPDGKDWEVCYDCAEDLGIVKYEPPMRADAGDAAPNDPYFDKYTDIENIRNFPDVFQESEEVVVTEKVDGTSCRIGIGRNVSDDGQISFEWKAGSRSLKRKKPTENIENSVYWHPYTLDNIRNMIEDIHSDKTTSLKEVILYGEVYGRVRGGHKSLHYGKPNNLNFAAFDLKVDGKFVDYEVFKNICSMYDVPMVPHIITCSFDFDTLKGFSTGESILAKDNGMEEPHMREGVVVKPIREREDPKCGRVILKMINDDYILLKNKAYEKGEVTDYTDH